MKNKLDKIFDGLCEICGKTIKKDEYGQGTCPYCGWINCFLNEENPDTVALPNTISLNRAKQLFAEGKPFEPDFDDFIKALHSYGEMQFEYNTICYAVELVGSKPDDIKIQLYNPKTDEDFIFNDDEDFKNNAKVEGKPLKDIWNDTTDRYWLQ